VSGHHKWSAIKHKSAEKKKDMREYTLTLVTTIEAEDIEEAAKIAQGRAAFEPETTDWYIEGKLGGLKREGKEDG
jgi:hypothetical protein